MKTTLIIWIGFFFAYLFVDKFLFKGQLGKLFREGWGQYFRDWSAPLKRWMPRCKRDSIEVPQVPQASVEVIAEDDLVLRKRYVSGQRVPAGDISPKSESTTTDNPTFASTTKANEEPEVLEWRAPSFQKKEVPKPLTKVDPPRWEDEDFAMIATIVRNEETGVEEIIQVPDPERIRREVAARLEAIHDAEILTAMIASDEEKYDVEQFETSTYR